jgi:hypothetical protein
MAANLTDDSIVWGRGAVASTSAAERRGEGREGMEFLASPLPQGVPCLLPLALLPGRRSRVLKQSERVQVELDDPGQSTPPVLPASLSLSLYRHSLPLLPADFA